LLELLGAAVDEYGRNIPHSYPCCILLVSLARLFIYFPFLRRVLSAFVVPNRRLSSDLFFAVFLYSLLFAATAEMTTKGLAWVLFLSLKCWFQGVWHMRVLWVSWL
jgi:hypothetical protein